jgi:hypothetical protein
MLDQLLNKHLQLWAHAVIPPIRKRSRQRRRVPHLVQRRSAGSTADVLARACTRAWCGVPVVAPSSGGSCGTRCMRMPRKAESASYAGRVPGEDSACETASATWLGRRPRPGGTRVCGRDVACTTCGSSLGGWFAR